VTATRVVIVGGRGNFGVRIGRALSGDAGTMCCEILAARFLHPVRPGDRLTIVWEERTAGEFGFAGSTESPPCRVIVGTLRMRTR